MNFSKRKQNNKHEEKNKCRYAPLPLDKKKPKMFKIH